ncbi:hypothetical protein H5368_02165 [Luteimonas sp. MC1782]|uniref:hypothetical protein n=1 Tax=Luteimonas sp. MC1782 TaxID=2760305 RepID=UPI0016017204|nr:hypothetical protein [Luteimonas sp. MC1782]MBB1471829.1 hypothetical protein [Luteimonas sp. MC1782]
MNELITVADISYFQTRYEKTWQHTLSYAIATAIEYAEEHAPKSAKFIVAQLHLRYVMQTDPGEKQLIRHAIDGAIEAARWAENAHTPR